MVKKRRHDPKTDHGIAKDKDEKTTGQQQGAFFPTNIPTHLRPLAVKNGNDKAICQYQGKGKQIMAAQVGGLNEYGLGIEAITEIKPGKTGKKNAAQIIKPDPEYRRRPDQDSHRPFPVP